MSPDVMKDMTIHILRLLITEKFVSQKNTKILKQLLGDFTPQFLNELIKVKKNFLLNLFKLTTN